MFPQLLWIHMRKYPPLFLRHYFFAVIYHLCLWLLLSFCCLFHNALPTLGRGDVIFKSPTETASMGMDMCAPSLLHISYVCYLSVSVKIIIVEAGFPWLLSALETLFLLLGRLDQPLYGKFGFFVSYFVLFGCYLLETCSLSGETEGNMSRGKGRLWRN